LELRCDTLNEAVETDIEAGGTREVQPGLDIGSEVRSGSARII
jgi:hypothetical protein